MVVVTSVVKGMLMLLVNLLLDGVQHQRGYIDHLEGHRAGGDVVRTSRLPGRTTSR